MSTQSLTPAEQAAAEVLAARHNASDATYSYSAAAFHGDARAVVAAVEPHLTIAALESAKTLLDELAAMNVRVGRGTAEGPWIAAGVQGAALAIRDQIRELRQSLSRPTSEEH
jgi:hypothetical protein